MRSPGRMLSCACGSGGRRDVPEHAASGARSENHRATAAPYPGTPVRTPHLRSWRHRRGPRASPGAQRFRRASAPRALLRPRSSEEPGPPLKVTPTLCFRCSPRRSIGRLSYSTRALAARVSGGEQGFKFQRRPEELRAVRGAGGNVIASRGARSSSRDGDREGCAVLGPRPVIGGKPARPE